MLQQEFSLVGEMTADNFEVLLFPTIQVANAIPHIRNRDELALF
jgi:hypothetical protein